MKRFAILAAMIFTTTAGAAMAGDCGFGFCGPAICHEKAVFIKYEPQIVEEIAFKLVPFEKKVCFKDAYGHECCEYVIDFKKVEVPVKRIVWKPIKVDIHGKPIIEAAVATTVVAGAAAPAPAAALVPAPGAAPAPAAAPAAVAVPGPGAAPAAAPAPAIAPAPAPAAPAPALPPAADAPAAAETASILGATSPISAPAAGGITGGSDAIPAPSL
jgi:hypothetical protein